MTYFTIVGFNRPDDLMLASASRVMALMLLSLYVLYLFFMLGTHDLWFNYEDSDGDEDDPPADAPVEPHGLMVALLWLVFSLVCITLCTSTLLSKINGSIWATRKTFLGFVLLPFLGNTEDFVSACVVAWKDELDITIFVTIGSSSQILLFTLPFLVILGWCIGQPMTLHFQDFETIVVFLGVFIVNGLVQKAISSYLSGATCIAL